MEGDFAQQRTIGRWRRELGHEREERVHVGLQRPARREFAIPRNGGPHALCIPRAPVPFFLSTPCTWIYLRRNEGGRICFDDSCEWPWWRALSRRQPRHKPINWNAT